MPDDTPWSRLPLDALVPRLGRAATPERGTRAAALLASAGCALAAGAVRGSADEAPTWAAGRAAELDALGRRALELLDALEGDLEREARARELPETDETRAGLSRKAERRAVERPLELMELAVAALRILAVGAPRVEPAAAGVAASSATVLAGALEVARPELSDALSRTTDAAWAAPHRMAADALSAESAALLEEVRREAEQAA